MPSCWQLSPFTKDKRANKGFVFPGSRKQAGPRVGLDFRAWKGELRHEWQVLKSPEPGSQGAGPGATGSVLELAEPGNPQRVSHACHAWGKLFRLNHEGGQMADHLLSARSKGRQETRCQEIPHHVWVL